MGVDDLAMQGARASATMILTIKMEQFGPHTSRVKEWYMIQIYAYVS